MRATVARLDRALDLGLRFGFAPDAELALRRGHARNAALAIRRAVALAAVSELDQAERARSLGMAAALAEELIDTVGWIQRRVLEAEAGAPAGEWSATWSGRLLSLAARLLPAGERRDFVEDHCANLGMAGSRLERLAYLAGLLAQMPDIAAAALAAGPRDTGGFSA